MDEKYLQKTFEYLGGEKTYGFGYDEWKGHMNNDVKFRRKTYDYLGGEKQFGSSFDDWSGTVGFDAGKVKKKESSTSSNGQKSQSNGQARNVNVSNNQSNQIDNQGSEIKDGSWFGLDDQETKGISDAVGEAVKKIESDQGEVSAEERFKRVVENTKYNFNTIDDRFKLAENYTPENYSKLEESLQRNYFVKAEYKDFVDKINYAVRDAGGTIDEFEKIATGQIEHLPQSERVLYEDMIKTTAEKMRKQDNQYIKNKPEIEGLNKILNTPDEDFLTSVSPDLGWGDELDPVKNLFKNGEIDKTQAFLLSDFSDRLKLVQRMFPETTDNPISMFDKEGDVERASINILTKKRKQALFDKYASQKEGGRMILKELDDLAKNTFENNYSIRGNASYSEMFDLRNELYNLTSKEKNTEKELFRIKEITDRISDYKSALFDKEGNRIFQSGNPETLSYLKDVDKFAYDWKKMYGDKDVSRMRKEIHESSIRMNELLKLARIKYPEYNDVSDKEFIQSITSPYNIYGMLEMTPEKMKIWGIEDYRGGIENSGPGALIRGLYGEETEKDVKLRKMWFASNPIAEQMYNEQKRLDGLTSLYVTNSDPAPPKTESGSLVTNVISRLVSETSKGIFNDINDRRAKISLLESAGIEISPEQYELMQESLLEASAKAIKGSLPVMADIMFNMGVLNTFGSSIGIPKAISKLAKGSKIKETAMTIAYNMISDEIAFQMSGEEPGTGTGERMGQELMVRLFASKYDRIWKRFGARVLGGTAFETIEETSGQLLSEYLKTGDFSESALRSIGGEDWEKQLPVLAITSFIFSLPGSSIASFKELNQFRKFVKDHKAELGPDVYEFAYEFINPSIIKESVKKTFDGYNMEVYRDLYYKSPDDWNADEKRLFSSMNEAFEEEPDLVPKKVKEEFEDLYNQYTEEQRAEYGNWILEHQKGALMQEGIEEADVDFIQQEKGASVKEKLSNYLGGDDINQEDVQQDIDTEAEPQQDFGIKVQRTEEETKKLQEIAKKRGVKVKNIEGLYDVNRNIFGQNEERAMAGAIATDKVIETMAKRAGIPKKDMYARIRWKQSEESELKGDNTVFQGTSPVEQSGKLVAFHNLSENNFKNADKIGGLPMPSIAVTKQGVPFEGYGEITLIADKDMVDPEKGARTFASDIYTPRYPEITYTANEQQIVDNFGDVVADIPSGINSLYSIQDAISDGGVEGAYSNPIVQASYLKEKGKLPKQTEVAKPEVGADLLNYYKEKVKDGRYSEFEAREDEKFKELYLAEKKRYYIEKLGEESGQKVFDRIYGDGISSHQYSGAINELERASDPKVKIDEYQYKRDLDAMTMGDANTEADYKKWVDEKLSNMDIKEEIFDGWTKDGYKKYIDHNIENVMKILRKENMRGGEAYNYGTGSIRSVVAPEFGSLDEMRGAKDRIVSKEEFTKEKKEVTDELLDIIEAIKETNPNPDRNQFIETDRVMDILKDGALTGNYDLAEYGYDVSKELYDKIFDFMDRLKNMSTEYFESKPERVVDLSEFKTAVVPNNTSAEVIKSLEDKGVEVVKYDQTKEGGRKEALDNYLSQNQDLLFQQAEEPQIWKSTALEGVQKITQKAGTPEQWVKMISDKGGKGTSQELEWIGLEDFLKDFAKQNNLKSVPKEVVEQYIQDNKIEIVEVEKTSEEKTLEFSSSSPQLDFDEAYSITFGADNVEFNSNNEWGANMYGYKTDDGTWELVVGNDVVDEYDSYQELYDEAQAQYFSMLPDNPEEMQESYSETKYGEYTLSGGKNYREILLTMPRQSTDNEYLNSDYESAHWKEKNILAHIRLKDRVMSNGEKVLFVEEIQSDWAQEGKKKGFQTKELKRKINEFEKDDNRWWELIEEIREFERDVLDKHISEYSLLINNGYKPKYNIEGDGNVHLYKTINGLADTKSKPVDLNSVSKDVLNAYNKILSAYEGLDNLSKEKNAIAKKYGKTDNRTTNLVPPPELMTSYPPDMPYKKTDQWVGMASRRILQMASEGGYDRVSWVTGEQSAHRYKLSDKVNYITASLNGHRLDTSHIFISTETGTISYNIENSTGKILNESGNINTNATGKTLDEVIGKSLSEEIVTNQQQKEAGLRDLKERERSDKEYKELRDEALSYMDPDDILGEKSPEEQMSAERSQRLKDLMSQYNKSRFLNEKEYSGEGLDIGGDGMKSFYNSIVPKIMQKEARRFDKKSKVEVADLSEDVSGRGFRMWKKGVGSSVGYLGSFDPGTNPEEIAKQNGLTMSEVLIKPHTALGDVGSGIIGEQLSIPISEEMRLNTISAIPLFQHNQGAMSQSNGNFIVHALTDPNISTPLHELAHIYEHFLDEAERSKILNWTGDKEWTVDTSEKFARGFERYLAEGKAPKKELQSIFDRFKKWLTDIYNGIKGSAIDLELNDDMKAIYDAMFEGDQSVQEASKKSDGKTKYQKSSPKRGRRDSKATVDFEFDKYTVSRGKRGLIIRDGDGKSLSMAEKKQMVTYGDLGTEMTLEEAVEKEYVSKVVDNARKLSKSVRRDAQKRVKKVIKGLKPTQTAGVIQKFAGTLEETGDLDQAFEDAIERAKEYNEEVEAKDVDNFLSRNLDVEFENLPEAKQMKGIMKYAQDKLYAPMETVPNITDIFGEEVSELISDKTEKGDPLLSPSEIKTILKEVKDVKRSLEKEGKSEEYIKAKIDAVIDSNVKRRLYDRIDKQLSPKLMSNNNQQKLGLYTLEWIKFAQMLKAVMSVDLKTEKEINGFDEFRIASEKDGKVFELNEDESYKETENWQEPVEYLNEDGEPSTRYVYPELHALGISPAMANILVSLKKDRIASARKMPGYKVNEVYTLFKVIQEMRRADKEKRNTEFARKRERKKKAIVGSINAVAHISASMKLLMKSITKLSSKNDTGKLFDLLNKEVERLKTLEISEGKYSSTEDHFALYESIINHIITLAKYSPNIDAMEENKAYAKRMIDSYLDYTDIEYHESVVENYNKKYKDETLDNIPTDAYNDYLNSKRRVEKYNRKRKSLEIKKKLIDEVTSIKRMPKTNADFKVYKEQFRQEIKSHASIYEATDLGDREFYNPKNEEKGLKRVLNLHNKIINSSTYREMRSFASKGSVVVQSLVKMLNKNNSKEFDQVFTNLVNSQIKAQNLMFDNENILNKRMMDALGVSSLKSVNKILRKLASKEVEVRDKKNQSFDQLQMATLYGWNQDLENEIKLQNTAEAHGFRTGAEYVKWVEDNLLPEAKSLYKAFKGQFDMFTEDVRRHHEETMGVPSTVNPTYIPRQISKDAYSTESSMVDQANLRAYSLMPKQLNTLHRVVSSQALESSSDKKSGVPSLYDLAVGYTRDMSYKLSMYNDIDIANSVISNPKFQEALVLEVGHMGARMFNDMLSKAINPPSVEPNYVTKAIQNIAVSRLMYNIPSAIKQPASLMLYPAEGFGKSSLRMMGDKKLREEFKKRRKEVATRKIRTGGSFSEESQAFQEGALDFKMNTYYKLSNKLGKESTKFSRWADMATTSIGEYFMFGNMTELMAQKLYQEKTTRAISKKDAYKLLFNNKESIIDPETGEVLIQDAQQFRNEVFDKSYEATTNFTESSQQSANSFFKLPVNVVNRNQLTQLLSFYKSAVVQQHSLAVENVVALARLRSNPDLSTKEKAIKAVKHLMKAITYHGLVNTAFQYTALGFPNITALDDDEKEDLKWAFLLGNLGGVFIAGDIVISMFNLGRGKKYGTEYRPMLTSAFTDIGKEYYKFIQDVNKSRMGVYGEYENRWLSDAFGYMTDRELTVNMYYERLKPVFMSMGLMGINPEPLIKNFLAIKDELSESELRAEIEGYQRSTSEVFWDYFTSVSTGLFTPNKHVRFKNLKTDYQKKFEKEYGIELEIKDSYRIGDGIIPLVDGNNQYKKQVISDITNREFDKWLRENKSKIDRARKRMSNSGDEKKMIRFIETMQRNLPAEIKFHDSKINDLKKSRPSVVIQEMIEEIYNLTAEEVISRNADALDVNEHIQKTTEAYNKAIDELEKDN